MYTRIIFVLLHSIRAQYVIKVPSYMYPGFKSCKPGSSSHIRSVGVTHHLADRIVTHYSYPHLSPQDER